MKLAKPLSLLLVAVASLVSMALPSRLEAAPKPGQPAPDFRITTTSGQTVTLGNYKGRVLVVDFFATWCRPCQLAIPHLVEMNRRYGRQGLQILGLSADDDGEQVVRAFAGEYHVNYPLALAGDSVAADYGVRSVPVMFVIDKKGLVAEVYRGSSEEMGKKMEQLVKRLLAEK